MEYYISIAKQMQTMTAKSIIVKKGLFGTSFIHEPSGKKFKKFQVYLAPEDALILEKTDNLSEKVVEKMKGLELSGSQLDCYATDGGDYLVYQVSRFVPYAYEPTMEAKYIDGEAAKAMYKLLTGK
jgi:hypothetical protein